MANPNDIRTYHGIYMDPFSAKEDEIDIKDIAHALSLLCRANGHIKHFYSVAQHCLNCEKEAAARELGDEIRLFCLLHDATECYISDITRPVKRRMPEYCAAEEKLAEVIYRKLAGKLPDEFQQKAINDVDDTLLHHEFFNLCGAKIFEVEPKLYADITFDEQNAKEVEQSFLSLYNELICRLEAKSDG